MKVKNVTPVQVDHLVKKNIDETHDSSGKVLLFKRQLSSESDAVYTSHIQDLIDDIAKQGLLLNKRADIGEMQKYREMVTGLLKETVSNGFAFNKEGKIGANGRNKVFVTVKKINEKLDEMTQKILNEEKNNLNLLDDVDDIRGLLVDLYS